MVNPLAKPSRALLPVLAAVLVVAPLAGAHLTNLDGSLTSAFFTGDNCRYAGSYATENPVFDDFIYPKTKGSECPNLNSGVSGTYVGSTVAYLGGDVFPLSIPPLVTLLPQGYVTPGFILCDMEVLSLSGGWLGDSLFGDPKQDPLDPLSVETVVDDEPTGLVVPDGTFDDGGIGGACHTDAYTNPNFNTPGCSGTSHAEDGASGANVWIGATCDFSGLIGSGDCVNDIIFTGGATLEDCVYYNFCQITDPKSCKPTFIACGPDGFADAVNYGEGGGSVQFAAGDDGKTGPFHSLGWLLDNKEKEANLEFFGVRYPSVDVVGHCPASTALAATFVYQGVEVNAGDIAHKTLGTVSGILLPGAEIIEKNGKQSYPNDEHTLVVGGWIDWTPDELGEGAPHGNATPNSYLYAIRPCEVPLPGPFPTLGDLVSALPVADGLCQTSSP